MPPDFHILMRCDEVACERWTLPADHRIRRYAPGDEAAWARIERAAGAFPGRVQAQVEAYLLDRYDPDALARRCLLAVDGAGRAVGVCTAWREPQGLRDVASLHGLAVEPAAQGRGVGRALLDEAMRLFEGLGETPVYARVPVQSLRAIALLVDVGFYPLKTETFGDHENPFDLAAGALRGRLDARTYERFMDTAR